MRTDVIVVAAGNGLRAGEGLPKQYRPLGGVPVLRHTLRGFLGRAGIRHVLPVISPEHAELCAQALAGLDGVLQPGGGRRHAPGLGARRP